jgi:hypothetical protein
MNKFKVYKEAIDIDYYAYFTKAYFAFNAYLKAQYPDDSDRDKIKKMKDNGIIESKFKQLIESERHFKDDLLSLKSTLETALIKNQEEYIFCSKVKIYDHEQKALFCESYCGVSYDVRSINGEKFTCTVRDISSNPFKYEELEDILSSLSISHTQKDKVKDVINGYVASYSVDLSNDIASLETLTDLTRTQQDEIIKRMYRGYIEIIYSLRNALFHSEVEPNNEVMKVYKFAYFILRKIVHKIPTT